MSLVRFPYEGIVHLAPDIDSIRIISNGKCELLHRIAGMLLYVILDFSFAHFTFPSRE